MPFSLSDRFLYGFLATEDRDYRILLAAIVRIEADPVGSCDGVVLDRTGRELYIAAAGRFWVYDWIERNGRVYFSDVLARR